MKRIEEVATALMAADGYKTLSHEVLIAYLKEFYQELSSSDIALADQLRQLRNKIGYRGFFVTPDFVDRNEANMNRLVNKLLGILSEKVRR